MVNPKPKRPTPTKPKHSGRSLSRRERLDRAERIKRQVDEPKEVIPASNTDAE